MTSSPVPTAPSPESVRLMARMRGARKMMERARPHGFRLWLLRRSMAAFVRKATGAPSETVHYGVPGVLATPEGADTANGVLLWVHGGGFVSGTPLLEKELAAAYAAEARVPVFLPRYRLAPEHPFPAAADDLLAAYRDLLDRFPAGSIRLGGTSAGGFLAAALLGDLARAGLPMPEAVVLLSPVLDLDPAAARRRDEAHPDPHSSPEFLAASNKAYAGDASPDHPRLDVLGADMAGWPPVLVQAGDTECIADDAVTFGAAMRAAGAACEVQLWPGQVHAFPGIGTGRIPEAAAAKAYGARHLAGRAGQ